MRIISNEKTDDCSSYLERKKGLVNFNSIITKNSENYNNTTNNFKINSRNNIVKSKSYNSLNNIKRVQPYFKCNPNNDQSKTTINLNNGQISIFDYSSSNNADQSNNCYINNNVYKYNNFTYTPKNNYLPEECVLNYLIKNITKPTLPTSIIIDSYTYNRIINIYGENTNTFVDQENILKFENLKKYNYYVIFVFTLSGQSIPISDVKQYKRAEEIDFSNQIIIEEYKTNKLFENSWDLNNIDFALNNPLKNFSLSDNSAIYPEFNYEIHDYYMEIQNGCICKKKSLNENINYIDFSFTTLPPTRTDVNPNNYKILLKDISKIIQTSNINVLVPDFSYYLIQDFSGEYYNTFIGPSINNKLTFNINKNYKLFVGNTRKVDETNKGVDLSGLLCDFSFSIIQPDSSIYNSYSIDISSLNGYDNSFNIPSHLSKSNDYFDISISNAIDIADNSDDQKIKNYYLGVDISNILVKDISINELITTQVSDISKIFELQIDQLFLKDRQTSRKELEFYYLQEPTKTDIIGTIDISKIRYFNPDNMNYFFGINYLNIDNIQLKIIYDISLSSFDASYLVNDILGNIDISINFSNISKTHEQIINNPTNKNQQIITISYESSFDLTNSNLNSQNENINKIYNFDLIYNINTEFLDNPFYNFQEDISNTGYYNITGKSTKSLTNELLLQNSFPIQKFKDIFNINFCDNNLSNELILCNPGIYTLISDASYVQWSDFKDQYDHTIKLKQGQLLWNFKKNAFTTRDIDDNYPYIDYSIYIDNNENDLRSLAILGNNIYSQDVDDYWNLYEQYNSTVDIKTPQSDHVYKFITLKIDNSTNNLYESNIILISVYEVENNNYKKLILNDDFIMYISEENLYYKNSNTNNLDYSAWMNASIRYSSIYHNNSIKAGGGCYSNIPEYYLNKEQNDYELYIPYLNSRSTTGIYLKIGLPINSSKNIGRVRYRLPKVIM
jgi:hypothetical protein